MRGLELAARRDAGVLQLGVAKGLGRTMRDAEAQMAEQGLALDRSRLLLVLPMYVARTSAAAMGDIRDAAAREQQAYWLGTLGLPDPGYDAREHAHQMAGSGSLIVGAPEDCIGALQAKLDEVGPVGGLLVADHDWAPWEGWSGVCWSGVCWLGSCFDASTGRLWLGGAARRAGALLQPSRDGP